MSGGPQLGRTERLKDRDVRHEPLVPHTQMSEALVHFMLGSPVARNRPDEVAPELPHPVARVRAHADLHQPAAHSAVDDGVRRCGLGEREELQLVHADKYTPTPNAVALAAAAQEGTVGDNGPLWTTTRGNENDASHITDA